VFYSSAPKFGMFFYVPPGIYVAFELFVVFCWLLPVM